jgi:3-hydroxy-5-methyl-1-naphthoate 3-O-methyltransferase
VGQSPVFEHEFATGPVGGIDAIADESEAVTGLDGLFAKTPGDREARGHCRIRTVPAAHDFDLFSRLAGGAGITVAGLTQALDLHPRPAEMLLTGCAALGLLEKTDGRYRNTPLSEAYLVRGKPYYFGGFVQMADKRLYAGWGRLTEALRTNRPTTWDPAAQSSIFDGEDPMMLALFWEAMHSVSTMTARKLGEAVDISHFRRLLDIGGRSGAYDNELCKH